MPVQLPGTPTRPPDHTAGASPAQPLLFAGLLHSAGAVQPARATFYPIAPQAVIFDEAHLLKNDKSQVGPVP